MTEIIKVSHDQVSSAKTLIEIAGGPEHVEPIIVKIANAKPAKNKTRKRRRGLTSSLPGKFVMRSYKSKAR